MPPHTAPLLGHGFPARHRPPAAWAPSARTSSRGHSTRWEASFHPARLPQRRQAAALHALPRPGRAPPNSRSVWSAPACCAVASRPASQSRTGSVRSLVAAAISCMRTGDCEPPDGGPVLKAVVTAGRGSVRCPFVRQAVRLDGRPGPGCGTHTAPASRCALNRPHLSKAPNPGSSTRDTASGRRCKRTPPGDPRRPTTHRPHRLYAELGLVGPVPSCPRGGTHQRRAG